MAARLSEVMGGKAVAHQTAQEEGLVGRLVGKMVRRSVKKNFRNVYWNPPVQNLTKPTLFFCNHHGWYDGYLMYHLVTHLGIRSLDWIQEFDSFPLFAKIGGLPYRLNDPVGRANTIRQTIRLMKSEGRSLVLFPEGILHYPPDVYEFGETFDFLKRKVPQLSLVPVAISYQHALHERPEAFIRLGQPLETEGEWGIRGREVLTNLLKSLNDDIKAGRGNFQVLAPGTPSINESLGFDKHFKKRGKDVR